MPFGFVPIDNNNASKSIRPVRVLYIKHISIIYHALAFMVWSLFNILIIIGPIQMVTTKSIASYIM